MSLSFWYISRAIHPQSLSATPSSPIIYHHLYQNHSNNLSHHQILQQFLVSHRVDSKVLAVTYKAIYDELISDFISYSPYSSPTRLSPPSPFCFHHPDPYTLPPSSFALAVSPFWKFLSPATPISSFLSSFGSLLKCHLIKETLSPFLLYSSLNIYNHFPCYWLINYLFKPHLSPSLECT